MVAQGAELAVFGAKLVAPFGDAVGFVDGEQGDGDAASATRCCRLGPGAPVISRADEIPPFAALRMI